MAKIIPRPNRNIKIKRELYNCLHAISYWQVPAMTTNEFIEELLMVLARQYGDMLVQDSNKAKKQMETLLSRTNVLTDANQNNNFQEIKV